MNTIDLGLFFLLVLSLGQQVWSAKQESQGMANRHLVVAAEMWEPFWGEEYGPDGEWEHPQGRVTYSGIMWDILMLMKRTKNCTFTVVPSIDGLWGGTCYGLNNCTGMIGMANRKDIDFAIGKPFVSENKC